MTFEQDQLSGPYGPQFIGYGPTPEPSLRSVFVNAVVLAAIAGVVMLISGAL